MVTNHVTSRFRAPRVLIVNEHQKRIAELRYSQGIVTTSVLSRADYELGHGPTSSNDRVMLRLRDCPLEVHRSSAGRRSSEGSTYSDVRTEPLAEYVPTAAKYLSEM